MIRQLISKNIFIFLDFVTFVVFVCLCKFVICCDFFFHSKLSIQFHTEFCIPNSVYFSLKRAPKII